MNKFLQFVDNYFYLIRDVKKCFVLYFISHDAHTITRKSNRYVDELFGDPAF